LLEETNTKRQVKGAPAHQCNKGWVCSVHTDEPVGHRIDRSICNSGGLPCDNMDCPDTKYVEGVCMHVWIIARATGPQSKGVCNVCDEEKLFDNNIDVKAFSVGKPKD